MKHSKLVVLMLLALLALSGISQVFAQDALPAVDLVMWSSDDDVNNVALKEQFDKWAALRSPGSTLDIQNKPTEDLRNDFQTAGLAGSGLPEMVLGPNDNIGVFVTNGLLLPLDDLFDTAQYPTNLAAGQLDGATYAIPITSGNHLMLMYNKSLVPTAPDTWEDMVATAKKVTEENPDVVGLAYNQTEPFWLVPIVFGFGGTVWGEDGKYSIDTQPWIDALQLVYDLKFVDQVIPTECDYACADNFFKEGSAAMIFNGDWAINDYLDTEKSPALGADNLGLAPWPTLSNGERPRPYTAGKFISIPVGVEGDKLNAAVDFVTWATTDPEAVKAISIDTGRLPAAAGVTVDEAEFPILAESAAALESGVGMPSDGLRCMWDSVKPNLQAVYSDSMTPADAVSESQIAAEDCLANS
jgi:arabinogalactan oligomer/maltooligosaccharide transport system substrate-binding protein